MSKHGLNPFGKTESTSYSYHPEDDTIPPHEIEVVIRDPRTGEILKRDSVPARCARVTIWLDDDTRRKTIQEIIDWIEKKYRFWRGRAIVVELRKWIEEK